MSIIKEFKEFISKGNAVDMAIGIIIGAAYCLYGIESCGPGVGF